MGESRKGGKPPLRQVCVMLWIVKGLNGDLSRVHFII